MIKKRTVSASETSSMNGTIIIDLDTIHVIHCKILEYEFSSITYRFSIGNTEYQCECVSDIASVIKENHLQEIDNLEILCCNEKNQYIQLSLKADFLARTCSIRQSQKSPVLRCLISELLEILKVNNQFMFKSIVTVLFSLEKRMPWWVSINFVAWLCRDALADQWRRLVDVYLTFLFVPAMIVVTFFVVSQVCGSHFD